MVGADIALDQPVSDLLCILQGHRGTPLGEPPPAMAVDKIAAQEAAKLGHVSHDKSRRHPMKLVPVTCLALIAATPAVAAPQWIEDLCWAKAAEVHFSGRGEREAFIANCIADYTPTPRRTYKKPRY
jgi:hypothetical protein